MSTAQTSPSALFIAPQTSTLALDRLLTPAAIEFLVTLERRFGPPIDTLLAARKARQLRFDAGERPGFLEETRSIRASDFTVAPIPPDLVDRRVELTGPVDRKMLINGLNSGAQLFMADFEDATSPTWENLLSGQLNLQDAVRRTLSLTQEDGRTYQLNPQPATLIVRPRGLHLPEQHLQLEGQPLHGALVDFGLFFFHNAQELVRRGSGPYFYLPKLESHKEARLWNEVFILAQDAIGMRRGTIRATVLIETLPAAFEMDEILYELREHSAGLNCGRWDYIFSVIKKLRMDPLAILPDRAQVTMDQPFMRAYTRRVIQVCHRRGIHAMGGMAASIPNRHDEAANALAMERVRTDKLREVLDGHDGTWVAHPGLVPVAREVFDAHMSGPNQLTVTPYTDPISAQELLAIPTGARTLAGLDHNLKVALRYLEAWLGGQGCVPLYQLMEDAATAEISRAQVWQWRHHQATLSTGEVVTSSLVWARLDQALATVRREVGEPAFRSGRYDQAASLLARLVLDDPFEEFLTLPAYARLCAQEGR